MIRGLVIALAAGALFAPAAQATTLVGPAGGEPYATLLAGLYMPTPAGEVTLLDDGCPPNPSIACTLGRTVYTLPFDGDAGHDDRMILTHELGHVVDHDLRLADCKCGSDTGWSDLRRAFAGTLGLTAEQDYATGPDRMLERFADVYAACALYGLEAGADVITPSYRFSVPAAAFAPACRLIADAATAAGMDPAGAVPTGPVTQELTWLEQALADFHAGTQDPPANTSTKARHRGRRVCHRKGARAHGRRLRHRVCHRHPRPHR